MVKTGTRLQSQVCDTQVIVVRSSDSLDDLRAGGVPMIPLDAEKSADVQLDPAFAGGTVMGKRYVDEAGAVTGYEDVHTKMAMCRRHYEACGLGAGYLDAYVR